MTTINDTRLFQLKGGFARHHNLLIYFAARVVAETPKAYYLYGHGTTDTVRMGVCCKCGRTLTHPVSVELGIGPECGQHFHDWSLIGGYTKENIERLKGALVEVIVDTWVPKSQVVNTFDTLETVEIPVDHPMLKPRLPDPTIQTYSTSGKDATLAANNKGERVVRIKFPYDMAMIDRIRTLPGRMYHADEKCWSAPLLEKTVSQLVEWGFTLDEHLRDYLNLKVTRKATILVEGIPGLKGTLFTFQGIGVSFIENHGGNTLVADEMGLGKTIQALAWLQLHPELRPAVIVCPASLKLNWLKETEAWMTEPDAIVVSGTLSYHVPNKIIIINYDILPAWQDILIELKPKVLITDECHYYKSNTANRTKAIKAIGRIIPHVIALSGTPIVNRPIEMYNALKLIAPTLFPDAWKYARRYCNAHKGPFGWDFNGASFTEELHQILVDSCMIRRLKKDVLSDLPPKLYAYVPMPITNRVDYTSAEQDLIKFIKDTKGNEAARRAIMAEAFIRYETLKQLAVKGKLSDTIDWIDNFLQVDGKLVVFAFHTEIINKLKDHFGALAVKYDGSMSGTQKEEAKEAFQNNPEIRLFIGNIRAAGVGLTLTAASNVAFVELPWTPGDLDQCSDRCHRIGQHDNVTVHYLLAVNTVEERIARLIDSKRLVMDAVLDGKVSDEKSLLISLMEEYDKL